jgi:hypothetical protein
MNDISAAPTQPFKDRKTGLIVFGILEIIGGVFCALAVPLMLFSMVVTSRLPEEARAGTDPAAMVPGMAFYIVFAVAFIWMGIGSIKARRWARALWLVLSWVGFVSGVLGLLFWLFFMQDMFGAMGGSGQMPPGMVSVMKVVTTLFIVLIYIMIPGIGILFYGSRHVKATCEAWDPVERWTDRCPLPVLAMSLMLGIGGVSMLTMAAYKFAMPFFGVIITGVQGAVVVSALTAAMVILCRGIYKLETRAWWGTIALFAVSMVSWGLTLSRTGLMAYYEKMGMPEPSLELFRSAGLADNPAFLYYSFACFAGMLAFLVYLRRYFRFASREAAPAA